MRRHREEIEKRYEDMTKTEIKKRMQEGIPVRADEPDWKIGEEVLYSDDPRFTEEERADIEGQLEEKRQRREREGLENP